MTPLENLTFGGLFLGGGMEAVDDRSFHSAPARSHRLVVAHHTSRHEEVDTWKTGIRDLAAAWRFDRAESFIPVAGDRAHVAVAEGSVTAENGGVRFGDESRLRIEQAPALSLTKASFTTEC